MTLPTADDLMALDDAEFDDHASLVEAERTRRHTLATTASQVAEANRAYLVARDSAPGAHGATGYPLWVRPDGPHEVYPLGYGVEHDDRAYRADGMTADCEPGTPDARGWTDITDDESLEDA